MRPVSERFLRTVTGSHTMCARARLVAPFMYNTTGPVDANGKPINEIPIISGSVRFDASADVRGALTLTTHHAWPDDPLDGPTPYGNEIFVERGVVYGDGQREWVSLGYYRIERVQQGNAPNGNLIIQAKDRMAKVIDADLLMPMQIGAGASVDSVFHLLIDELYPGITITFDFNAVAATLAVPHIVEKSRFEFLRDLAKAYGCVMYFDYKGNLQVRTPTELTSPVWVGKGGRGGVLTEVSRQIDRDGVYNAVVATGEAAGELPPVRGVAWDGDVNSPTYFYGNFGQVPYFFSSTLLQTNPQCDIAAREQLRRLIGIPYKVDFNAVPNTALEVLDPIELDYGAARAERHVLDTLTVDLSPAGGMSGTTRKTTFG